MLNSLINALLSKNGEIREKVIQANPPRVIPAIELFSESELIEGSERCLDEPVELDEFDKILKALFE